MECETIKHDIEQKRSAWLHEWMDTHALPLDSGTCDEIMADVDSRLKHINPENRDEVLNLDICLLQLSVVAKSTWYHCACGVISPESGLVDVICPECGEIRQCGYRLNRSPWPLCVACLSLLMPNQWFDWLAEWMSERGLGKPMQSNAYAQHSIAGGAYSSAAKKSETGGAAYEGECLNSRAGAAAPDKYIECIDGMRIWENTQIIGLNWIALPMPDTVLSSIRV